MKYILFMLLFSNSFVCAEGQKEGETAMSNLMFGLTITDMKTYQLYRSKIEPIMSRLGIQILEEYEIKNVLKSTSGSSHINRVAVFSFPNESVKQVFFNDPEYIAAKPLFDISTSNFKKIFE